MLGWMTQNNDATIVSSVEMFVRQFAIRVELYLICQNYPKIQTRLHVLCSKCAWDLAEIQIQDWMIDSN